MTAPDRIWAGLRDSERYWTPIFTAASFTEYVRADILATTQRELAEARAERDEWREIAYNRTQAWIASELLLKAEVNVATTRAEASDRRIEALEKALRRARPYVDCAVHDDGGIDHCQVEYRLDLEAIDAALTPDTAEERHNG